MYNLKNTTKLSDVLYTLLCVVRLLVFMPLILTCLCFVPLMYLLGIKNAIDKWIKLNEVIVFDVVERNEQLCCENKVLNNVGRSGYVEIKDSDIATIEALHDLLLDAYGYSINSIALKRARELTEKMYKAFKN